MADSGPASPTMLRFEGFALDGARGLLLDAAGAEVPLRPKPLGLLRLLTLAAGRTLSKAELMEALWPDLHVTEDSLFQCVRELRRALGDPEGRLLRHLPRRGYLLDAEVRREAPRSGGASAAFPEPPRDRASLAVLPFEVPGTSGAAEADFADGLADELVTALSRMRSLLVIARTSSFAYRGRAVDVRRVGRELGVRYVVEGSVRETAGRLRIAARLVDAASAACVWADRFEGGRDDLFALQDAMTRAVAAAVEPRVLAAEVERALRKGTADLTAYDLYLRALPNLAVATEPSMGRAAALLRQALERDPGHGRAAAWLALCLLFRSRRGWEADVEGGAREAVRLARHALAADNADALVLAAAGYIFTMVLGEHEQGTALAARALALDETSAFVWAHCGWVSLLGGELDEAIGRFGTAMRLDPISPAACISQTGTALAHLFSRRFDEAERWARRAHAADPDLVSPRYTLAAALGLQGRAAEARAMARGIHRCNPAAPAATPPSGTRLAAAFRHGWMTELWQEGLRRARAAPA